MIYLQDSDFTLHQGDVLEVLREMPDESVDCVITSPPYWGLRCYGVDAQLGLEPTPEQYVERMTEVFAEVRRVLAAHGTCWVNMGDSYAGIPQQRPDGGEKNWGIHGKVPGSRVRDQRARVPGLKPKDLCGIPWRLAFALQADGWYLRSDIVWSKPNPMPESVTDRPTKAHEYVFLLTKSPRYFFDQEAVREQHLTADRNGDRRSYAPGSASSMKDGEHQEMRGSFAGLPLNPAGRNIRSVWEIATQPYPEAHFATFPEELVRRCLLAGCPEQVCGECGKPRERVVEREDGDHEAHTRPKQTRGMKDTTSTLSLSGNGSREWERRGTRMMQRGFTDCGHDAYRPGIVLDPFMGSGTTALVARKHARRTVGIELNAEYCELIVKRTQQLSLLSV